jgi:Leucine-rich repeat (LRR) protein
MLGDQSGSIQARMAREIVAAAKARESRELNLSGGALSGSRRSSVLPQCSGRFRFRSHSTHLHRRFFGSLTGFFVDIDDVPYDDLVLLTALTRLDLSYNILESLPPALSCLSGLHELLCHNNRLLAVPAPLAALHSLRVLHLASNRLAALPSSLFQHMTMLRMLNLSHNRLVRLPSSLSALRNLQSLNAAHNALEELPVL